METKKIIIPISILTIILTIFTGCSNNETYYGIKMGSEVDSSFQKFDNVYCKSDATFSSICVDVNQKNKIDKIMLHTKSNSNYSEDQEINYNFALKTKKELDIKYGNLKCNNLYHNNYNTGSTLVGFKCTTKNNDNFISLEVINPPGVNGRWVSISDIESYVRITYEKIIESNL